MNIKSFSSKATKSRLNDIKFSQRQFRLLNLLHMKLSNDNEKHYLNQDQIFIDQSQFPKRIIYIYNINWNEFAKFLQKLLTSNLNKFIENFSYLKNTLSIILTSLPQPNIIENITNYIVNLSFFKQKEIFQGTLQYWSEIFIENEFLKLRENSILNCLNELRFGIPFEYQRQVSTYRINMLKNQLNVQHDISNQKETDLESNKSEWARDDSTKDSTQENSRKSSKLSIERKTSISKTIFLYQNN